MGLPLSFIPLLAAGQIFGSVTLSINDQTSVTITPNSCGSNLTGKWQAALSGGVCSSMQLWVTNSDCGDTPATGDLRLADVDQGTLTNNRTGSGTVSIPVNSLPFFVNGDAGGCGGEASTTHKFCAAVTMSSDLTCFSKTVVRGTTVSVVYDTVPPDPPTLLSAEGFDGAAAVIISPPSDAATVRLEIRTPDGAFGTAATNAASVTNVTIDNLTNDTVYTLRAFALDSGGIESAASNEITVKPRASLGFWGACREAGCTTGCNAAAGPFSLAALAALLLMSRRLRR